MIIGISGYMNSGKDTVGNMIKEMDCWKMMVDAGDFYREDWRCDKCWEIQKFAGKLKTVASLLTGIPTEKFEDQEFKKTFLGEEWAINGMPIMVREFLQRLGTEAIRDGLHRNAWVNALFSEYQSDSNWIITDTRFVNEAIAIKKRGGILVRVDRYKLDTSAILHPSETALDSWVFDYEIDNNGTISELREKVEKMMTEILEKNFEKYSN